jgi:acyl-CoA synthetase (AMP-forming)/AMP-acid ligase II
MSTKVEYKNIVEIITDSYSPAIILPESNLKIHYSSLRHAVNFLKTQQPFCNLNKGDIVSIDLPNSVEFIVTFFTLLSVQAVANPIKLSLDVTKLSEHFNQIKPKLVISSKKAMNYQQILDICGKNLISMYSVSIELIEQTFQIRQIIRKLHHEVPHHTAAAKPNLSFIHISGPRLDPALQTSKVMGQMYSKSDIAVILHTHGTTGTTKLVPLSHGAIIESIYKTSSTFQLTEKDSSYLIMPMYHAHGLIGILLTSFFAGSTVLFPKAMDVSGFWTDISRYGVTWFSAVPLYHQMLLALPKLNRNYKSGLRFVQSCGDRIAPELLLELERFLGVPVITSYTLTETSHMVFSKFIVGLHKHTKWKQKARLTRTTNRRSNVSIK